MPGLGKRVRRFLRRQHSADDIGLRDVDATTTVYQVRSRTVELSPKCVETAFAVPVTESAGLPQAVPLEATVAQLAAVPVADDPRLAPLPDQAKVARDDVALATPHAATPQPASADVQRAAPEPAGPDAEEAERTESTTGPMALLSAIQDTIQDIIPPINIPAIQDYLPDVVSNLIPTAEPDGAAAPPPDADPNGNPPQSADAPAAPDPAAVVAALPPADLRRIDDTAATEAPTASLLPATPRASAASAPLPALHATQLGLPSPRSRAPPALQIDADGGASHAFAPPPLVGDAGTGGSAFGCDTASITLSEPGSARAGSSGGGVFKAHVKQQTLRSLFKLPDGSHYIDNFHCALKSTILLQGRLFIFDRFFCFRSNIFGIETIRVIDVDRVASLAKKNHIGIPNSICVLETDGRRSFFTSFIKRADAFTIMETLFKARQTSLTRASVTPSTADRRDSDSHETLELDEDATADAADPADAADTDLVWPVKHEPPPECAENTPEKWNTLIDMDLPHASLRDVAQLFSSETAFFTRWHQIQKHSNVAYTPWDESPEIGRVRQLTFTTALNEGPLSPKTADCIQIQRGTMHHWSGLVAFVMQTEQSSPKIPMGEHFQVHHCWKTVPLGDSPKAKGVHITISMRVAFSKKLTFEGMITKRTTERSRQAGDLLKQLLQQHFSPPPAAAAQTGELERKGSALRGVLRGVSRKTYPKQWRDDVRTFAEGKSAAVSRPAAPSLQDLVHQGWLGWAGLACVLCVLCLLVLALEGGKRAPVIVALPGFDPHSIRIKQDDQCLCMCRS